MSREFANGKQLPISIPVTFSLLVTCSRLLQQLVDIATAQGIRLSHFAFSFDQPCAAELSSGSYLQDRFVATLASVWRANAQALRSWTVGGVKSE